MFPRKNSLGVQRSIRLPPPSAIAYSEDVSCRTREELAPNPRPKCEWAFFDLSKSDWDWQMKAQCRATAFHWDNLDINVYPLLSYAIPLRKTITVCGSCINTLNDHLICHRGSPVALLKTFRHLWGHLHVFVKNPKHHCGQVALLKPFRL